jgi:hypothetical protein
MDDSVRARLQIRAVLVVYRRERARRTDSPDAVTDFSLLRGRCLQLLDDARATLNGKAPWHADVLAELEGARAEVAADN